MTIESYRQLTDSAQIATALILIAVLLMYIASKLPDKGSIRPKSSKTTR